MAERKRIVATDMAIPDDLARKTADAGNGGYVVRPIAQLTDAEKKEVVVLVLLKNRMVTPELFQEMPNVKLLQSISAGVDFIDVASIPPQVTLCSNAGAYKDPIAEHVFGMILYFGKNLARNHERLRNGVFEGSTDGIFLREKTIGIIGAGGIGQSVARVAKGFNMRTIGINTSGRPVENFDAVWKMERLDDLLRQADVVVISLPLTNHTRNLIDAQKLGLMKEGCILVNVARGAIIVQDALYAHLKAHPRFKAGIDVWWRYPKSGEGFSQDYPFFELPNFLASPHNSDGVPEALGHGQEHAFSNVIRYLDGMPLERVVDKADYVGIRRPSGH
ncbi:MAG: 2-hydroxyacid dehydrogenase [Thaumarchaeota archaeon]|nr:2-hydroxyacid dehydrogenase [Nitrososphaerota archaeon]